MTGSRIAWLLPLLLAGCQAGSGGDSGGKPPPSGTTGCGQAPAQTGYLTRTMTVAGKAREYQLYVPPGVTGTTPLPLVFVFHHSGGTIQNAEDYGIQDAAAAAGDQAIFLFPQALPYGGGVGWNLGCTDYDMQFVDAMLAATGAEQCIDTNRIFATGFSWGADMTIATGCCRGDVMRAIAPTSGTGWGLTSCTAKRPAYRVTIGTEDPYYKVSDVHAVTETYRQAQGCSTGTAPATPTTPCLGYTGCAAPVIECVYPGLEHWFPTDGPKYVWKFFGGF
jgi:polyhydroxybutyrate depolymerase